MRVLARAMAVAFVVIAVTSRPSPAAVGYATVFSKVVSAEVQGLVFYADGVTPAAEVPVRIWDTAKKEFLFETKTDETGAFRLPTLKPGNYYVTFDWLKVELQVEDKTPDLVQQPHDVVVIIPRGLGFVGISQLNALLVASTVSEMAASYNWQKDTKPYIVSP